MKYSSLNRSDSTAFTIHVLIMLSNMVMFALSISNLSVTSIFTPIDLLILSRLITTALVISRNETLKSIRNDINVPLWHSLKLSLSGNSKLAPVKLRSFR